MSNNKKTFVRHFRIYFKNNHPAYIVDEEGNMYVFHKATHSKTSGGKANWKKDTAVVIEGDYVIVNTPIGGERILEAPIADPVPRVC